MPLLEVINVTKRFPGVIALRGVSMTLEPGEVVAALGENGAGKSTLMKILAGVQTPDEGEVRVDGQPVRINSVLEAQKLGIALIHQELNLADNLDVGSNIFLGREPRRFGLIDRRMIDEQSREFLARVGLKISPRTPVDSLTTGQQQLVEIAKALSTNARVLIMDEPTSSLSTHETSQLFTVIDDLRSRGVSIIYISHRLGEVKRLADRVVVLRDGQNAGSIAREEITHDRMVRMMVGRDISQFYVRQPHPPGELLLEVDHLRTNRFPQHPLSFRLRAGEIVGVAGLVGAGRSEMLQTIFGVNPIRGGAVRMSGKALRPNHSAIEAIQAGLALVPEDRKTQGLVLEMPVCENISLANLKKFSLPGGFRNAAKERDDASDMIRRLAIKTPSAAQIVQYLSGGNQQKVALAKWLTMGPKVLMLDEPTRGIDIGAKQEIYRLMETLAGQGMAILFVSSEMEEVLGMADRALVMHEGMITGELARRDLSEEAIMRHATGHLDSTHKTEAALHV